MMYRIQQRLVREAAFLPHIEHADKMTSLPQPRFRRVVN